MNVDALAWIAVAGLVAASFAAIAARSLRSFSRHELEEICQQHQSPERFAEILRCHESVALGVEFVVMLLISLSVAAGSGWTWQAIAATHSRPWQTFAITVVVLGLLLGVAIVWLPWSASRIGAA